MRERKEAGRGLEKTEALHHKLLCTHVMVSTRSGERKKKEENQSIVKMKKRMKEK